MSAERGDGLDPSAYELDTDLSNDERVELTRAIMGVLDAWGMNAAQQVALLDLPPKTPTRALRKYRDNTPFPETEAVNARLQHLVGIIDALRTTYPHNPAMGKIWMRQKNSRFQQRAPLQLMLEEGIEGVEKVRAHLDCAYDWFNS